MDIPRALAGPWRRAYNLWLDSKAPNTRRAYHRAWTDLLAFTGKHPDRFLSADIQAWADHLAGHWTPPSCVAWSIRPAGPARKDAA